MKRFFNLICSLLTILMVGCVSNVGYEIDPILKNNPTELAKEHFQSGNKIEWMGCQGYVRYLPGIPKDHPSKTTDENVYWIKGTGDDLLSKSHMKYNDQAIEFAEAYNKKRIELTN